MIYKNVFESGENLQEIVEVVRKKMEIFVERGWKLEGEFKIEKISDFPYKTFFVCQTMTKE